MDNTLLPNIERETSQKKPQSPSIQSVVLTGPHKATYFSGFPALSFFNLLFQDAFRLLVNS